MTALVQRLRALRATTIVALGWLGLIVYAYPGYMSYDSVAQLVEARSGSFSDGHPPAMAALWQVLDAVIPGPFLMLVVQTGTFAIGAYLILRRRMSPRAAALAATALMWFPPIANTMSVIWKDSQMAGFLLLGAALVLDERRRVKLGGLACLAVTTAMRHNALAMTFPIIVVLFAWSPAHRAVVRYAIALAAWLAVTGSAQLATRALTDREMHIWHQSLAMFDITGTLRNAPDLSDAELRELLAGAPIKPKDHIQDVARTAYDPSWPAFQVIWTANSALFDVPKTDAERAAIARAWRAIVLGHPAAYLAYRWDAFAQLVQLDGTPRGSVYYFWYVDVQDPVASMNAIKHSGSPSWLQARLHEVMVWLSDSFVFHVGFYLLVALALVPLAWRDRVALAIVVSGLTGELALFFLAPSPDVRYSFWLMLATALGALLVFAGRYRNSSISAKRSA